MIALLSLTQIAAVGGLWVWTAAGGGGPAQPPSGRASVPVEVSSSLPAAGGKVRGRLAESAVRLEIPIRPGEFLRLSLVLEVPAEVSLSGAATSPPTASIIQHSSRVAISLIGARGDKVVMRVKAANAKATDGQYHLTVEEARPTRRGDEEILAAGKLTIEAAGLASARSNDGVRNALTKYESALQKWKELNRRSEIVETLLEIAKLREELGDRERARDNLDEAIRTAESLDSAVLEAMASNALARLYCRIGKGVEAIVLAERAQRAAEAAGDEWERARALTIHGYALEATGRIDSAEHYHRQAIAAWRTDGWKRGLAEALLELGYNLTDQGQESRAIEPLNEARGIWLALGDEESLVKTLQAFGALYSKLDRKEEALEHLYQAEALLPATSARELRGVLQNSIGQIYFDLGQYDRAREYFSRALELLRGTGYQHWIAGTIHQIGRCADRLGNRDEALKLFEESLSMYQEQGDARWQARLLEAIAVIQLDRGDTASAIETSAQALHLIEKEGDPYFRAACHRTLALAHHKAGQFAAAEQHYLQALGLLRRSGYRHIEAWTGLGLARLEADQGRLEAAKARLESLTDVVESVRADISGNELRASYFASIQQYFEFFVDVLMRLGQRNPPGNHSAAAFLVNERASSRTLMESLREGRVEIREGVDPALLEREKEINRALNRLAERQMEVRDIDGPEYKRIRDELNRATAEYEQVQALIRTRNPKYAALVEPKPLTLTEVQESLLDEDTVLLEYTLGEERGYLWAVSKSSFEVHVIPGRNVLEKPLIEFRQAITAREPREGETAAVRRLRIRQAEQRVPELAANLSAALLDPVADFIRKKRLLIVAGGALSYLPFAALRAPGYQGENAPPLIAENELTVAPSASTLAVMRTETAGRTAPGKWLAVLADPVLERDDPRLPGSAARPATGRNRASNAAEKPSRIRGASQDFARLPSTGLEAQALADLAPPGSIMVSTGLQASRETVQGDEIRDYRIVHFATHSVLHQDHPELSAVVLSAYDAQGKELPHRGLLRLHDIYNLRLPAELVVLSSCESQLGKAVHGEGLIGIVRGFLYAGSRRVVASLWRVDDMATKELMARFYGNMMQKGETPAKALRRAQVEMSRQPEWRSPYYWAAFVLQGEWR